MPFTSYATPGFTKQEAQSDGPEELDGYQLDRSAAGDRQLSTITHTVIEISNQEDET